MKVIAKSAQSSTSVSSAPSVSAKQIPNHPNHTINNSKIVNENTSNIIMALLLGGAGCAFASLTSENYVTINDKNNYGIFEGRNGGTGCLGQCQKTPQENNGELKCEKDESACILFKIFPILVGVCYIVGVSLLTFTYTSHILRLNKEIAAWVLMWVGFVLSISGLLVQTLVPVIDNKSLWDLHKNPIYNVKWGEGFTLMCFTIGLGALAIIFHGINNIKIFKFSTNAISEGHIG
jgi:hypothetical protein